MRPVKMNKIVMLAAAMYAVLEENRFFPQIVGFDVSVDALDGASDEYSIPGSLITGHFEMTIRPSLLKFNMYFNIAGDLVITLAEDKTYYTNIDEVTVHLEGDVVINFKEKSITRPKPKSEHVFEYTKNIQWEWQAIKDAAEDIIGTILAEKKSD